MDHFVYAGDTCQTISKINRFRFSELNNIFYAFGKVITNYPKVNNAYLSLNYRLNSKILRLSTFMAYLMKLLFPNALDKFQDDFSIKIIDQKPIYLKHIDLIIDNIINTHISKDYTLAANHCFIYNNYIDGEELDKLYGDKIYKLNVEQSKGLEFEMVICYNFFTSSKFQNIWEKIFKNLREENENYSSSINSSSKIKLEEILYQENLHYLIETLHLRNIYTNLSDEEIHKKLIKELDGFIYPKLSIDFDTHEFFEFCSEIKKFYVIITRPKTFLVFYETNLNKGRDSFFELMKSKSIEIIVEEENGNNTQEQFLNNVSNYFNNINLRVKSHEELRILGNKEFNEGHYSRAIYFYKTSRHSLLASISEVFYNEEIINERTNINDENDLELKNINEKIVNNITSILKIHEKNNLYNIIQKDNNRINISNILQLIINYLGKSLIFLKRNDEVIELLKNILIKYFLFVRFSTLKLNLLYRKNNNINEMGMVYYKYKKEYQLAFECFNSISNYKYALNSLIKKGNISEVFDYINKIAFYLGIIGYNDIYLKFVNIYFRKLSIERKKLNENFIKRLTIEEKKGLTNKNIIYNIFSRYLFQINKFQKEKNNEVFNEDVFEDLKNELKLNYHAIHFVDVYYFNKLKNILLELLKLFPEFIYFKSTSYNIKDLIKKCSENKNNNKINLNYYWDRYKYEQNKNKFISDKKNIYYNNLKIIINYFLNNSEYKNEQKFTKYIMPFLINHGYFYFELNKYFFNNYNKIKLFFDFALNNYDNNRYYLNHESVLEKSEYLDENYILYYLSYVLRVGINNFIKYNDKYIINNIIVNKYNFKLIDSLVQLNNNHFLSFKDIQQNIDMFLDYFLNEEKLLTRNKICKLLDIGSSLSLSLLFIYLKEKYCNNYTLYKNYFTLDTQSLFWLFQKLYQICNLISSTYINSFSYNKKIILFSLFSIFNVSPIPVNDKLFDKKIFKIFNSINGCLLNINSFLFDLNDINKKYNYLFDIFSSDNNEIYEQNFQILNIEGNNIVINNNILSILFRLMLSSLVETFLDINFNDLEYTPNIFSDKNQLSINGHYYSSILYYYNQLYFSIDEYNNSLDIFWSRICKNFSSISNFFPKIFNDKSFILDYYLKDLLLYHNVKPNILYSFLTNYLHVQKKGNFSINKNDIFLLIFLLKDIWNIDFTSNDYNNQDLSLCVFEKLDLCLDYINKGNTYIFSSLLILRRIFPLILQLFEFYLEKYINNKNFYIDIEKKNIKVFSFEQEKIFDCMRKRNILNEIKFYDDFQERIIEIIIFYFSALKNVLNKFSEFGYFYINKKELNNPKFDFWSNQKKNKNTKNKRKRKI